MLIKQDENRAFKNEYVVLTFKMVCWLAYPLVESLTCLHVTQSSGLGPEHPLPYEHSS